MHVQVYLVLLVCCSLYTAVRGGLPERIGVAILLAAVLASALVPMVKFSGFKAVEVGILTIDFAMLLCIGVLALFAQRYWPMWMAAILVNTVITHLLKLSPTLWPTSYFLANAAWSYPNPIILAVAAWRHQARVKRYGDDPPWSHALPAGA